MSSPEQIQSNIERTRASLSADVDRLNEKVSPGKVVGRRVDRVKGTATSVKDRVMGSDAASDAPSTVRRQTQGNPLAAGLIAFGIGWLVSSLPPASRREQDVAKLAEEKAGELAPPLKEKAQEVAGNLEEPLQHSAEQVKSAATDAAAQTADQAKSAVKDVKDPLQQ